MEVRTDSSYTIKGKLTLPPLSSFSYSVLSLHFLLCTLLVHIHDCTCTCTCTQCTCIYIYHLLPPLFSFYPFLTSHFFSLQFFTCRLTATFPPHFSCYSPSVFPNLRMYMYLFSPSTVYIVLSCTYLFSIPSSSLALLANSSSN